MRGLGETLNFSIFAARLDQRGSLTYTRPVFPRTPTGAAASCSPASTTRRTRSSPTASAAWVFSCSGRAGRTPAPKKANNIFLRYNFQLTRISNLLIPDLVPPNQLNVHLSTVSASYVHDTRDNVLDAHRGSYGNFEVDVSPKWLGSNFSFAQLLMQLSHYQNLHSTGIVWANNLRIGLEQPFAGSEVPLSSRFFAGGGSTLRGFPLNGAGPAAHAAGLRQSQRPFNLLEDHAFRRAAISCSSSTPSCVFR